MMKILHTSDWHLGQDFYSYDRTEEHTAFLEQLCEIVSDEQPDVLIVAGDIYHNGTPSNTVMRLFTDRLDAVCSACPTMQVVVIAGNHDSSSRLEVNRTLWLHRQVHIIGRIEKKEGKVDLDHHILPVFNQMGEKCGYVVALPHVFLHSFPLLDEETPYDDRRELFFQALANRVNEVNTEGLPVVMTAHMALTGSDITGHDTVRGGMEYLNVTDLKVPFDYLALGHIHCPQWLDETTARYCGSPVAVNFDERYGHSVTVVELEKGGEKPVCRYLPIHNPWPLKTLPSKALPFEEMLQELAAFPDDEQAYIRCQVLLPDVPPQNAQEQVQRVIKEKKCRFCCFKWEHPERTATERVQAFDDVEQMKEHSPVEVAGMYYEHRYGHAMDEEMKELLEQVVREVENKEEKRNKA